MRIPRKIVQGANLASNIALGRSMTRRASFMYAAKNIALFGGTFIFTKALGKYASIRTVAKAKVFECFYAWVSRSKLLNFYSHYQAPSHRFDYFTNTWVGFGQDFSDPSAALPTLSSYPMIPAIIYYTYGDVDSRKWPWYGGAYPDIFAYIYYMNDVPEPGLGDYDYSAKPGLVFPDDFDWSAIEDSGANEELSDVDNFLFDVSDGNFQQTYSGITINPQTGAQACCLTMGLNFDATVEYGLDPESRDTYQLPGEYYVEVSAFNLATDQAYRIVYTHYYRLDNTEPRYREISHANAIVDNDNDLHVFARGGAIWGYPSSIMYSLNGSKFEIVALNQDLEQPAYLSPNEADWIPRLQVDADNTVYAMYVTHDFGDIILCKRDKEGVFTVRHFFYDEPSLDIFITTGLGWDFCLRGDVMVIFGPESGFARGDYHVSFDKGDTFPIHDQLSDVYWEGSGDPKTHIAVKGPTFVEASPNGRYWVFGGYTASSQPVEFRSWMFHIYEVVGEAFEYRAVFTLDSLVAEEILTEAQFLSTDLKPTAAIDNTGCCKVKFFLADVVQSSGGLEELYRSFQIQDLPSYVGA